MGKKANARIQKIFDDLREQGKLPQTNKRKSKKNSPVKKGHVLTWKLVASLHDEKKIYFCTCQSSQPHPFRGCGAVGVQIRNGAINAMNEGRFKSD